MNSAIANARPAVLEAFRAYEQQMRLHNTRVGALLVVTLMPAGSALDFFVYNGRTEVPSLNRLGDFLELRLVCAALALIIWGMLYTDLGKRWLRALGMVVPLLPVIFMSWMIAVTEGLASVYFAGLILVLVAVNAVLRWTVSESLVYAAMVMLLYVGAVNAQRWVGPPLNGIHAPAYRGAEQSDLKSPGDDPSDPTSSGKNEAKTQLDVANAPPGLTSAGKTKQQKEPDLSRRHYSHFIFIAMTELIVVVGTYSLHRQRFREFSLRYELDENRHMLEESNRKLKELDQIKSRFFANISHELRTPLTLVLAPIESLRRRASASLTDEDRELLETMHANGMRLLKLINDLLDLVRLDSGAMKLHLEPVEVEGFIRGLVSSAQHVAQGRGIHLVARTSADAGVVQADRDKLDKVILNLVFNALKFTPAGGRVEVRADREGDGLRLQVEDSGMGITAEQLPHIFDRFWQADTSSNRKFQGAGIGLALVKELVEAHGGSVGAESTLGRGTTMTVRLPCGKAEAQPGATTTPMGGEATVGNGPRAPEGLQTSQGPALDVLAPADTWLRKMYREAELHPAIPSLRECLRTPEVPTASNRPTVLIADDEPDMLRFLRSRLAEDFQVLEAVDGRQAVELTRQYLPAVVLCDMMMPEMDGLAACRELRAGSSTQSIPIILLTARADEETKLAALAAGASDFLTKPFSGAELSVRLKNLILSHELQGRLARQNQVLEQTLAQLKEAESQLVSSEKMASLGRLSAGIMHEVNNPLNFIKTGLHVLRRKASLLPSEEEPEFSETLGDIEEGVQRVQGIVAELRRFAHPSAAECQPVPAEELVETALKFLSHELKDGIRLEKALEPGHVLWVNRNKMVQVLINLMQNAAYALRKKQFAEGTPTLRLESRSENGTDQLLVRDNGIGIEPDHRDKIFEPFFTTKDVGEGMGLGLSICYRILEEHKGRIQVRSQSGEFCEFILDLPRRGPESTT